MIFINKKYAVISLYIVANFSIAATIPTPSLLKCSEIKNDIQRLKCFDNTFITMTKSPQLVIKKDISSNNEILESTFGKTHLNTKEESAFNEIKSVIKSAKRNKRNKWVLKLDNDQIWQEKSGDKMARFKEGDNIIIKRGIMNTFKLKKIGTKRRISVKRIN
ncbi:MAG: hypothetical protein HRT52_10470 [Colwellia sp.]|nr:hypothetical protein [Colwellia sp.]